MLNESKIKIRSYKLPIISNNYFVQLAEANDAILEIIKELEKSSGKIIPTLKLYPNDCIIGIDDDWLYPPTMIEDLWNTHIKYPNNPPNIFNIISSTSNTLPINNCTTSIEIEAINIKNTGKVNLSDFK